MGVSDKKRTISLVKGLLDAHPFLKHGAAVTIRKIVDGDLIDLPQAKRDRLIAGHVQISFKDQNISRRDMWQLANHFLHKKTIYKKN